MVRLERAPMPAQSNAAQRAVRRVALALLRLARVQAVDVGRTGDGLIRGARAGSDLDKSWEDLLQEFTDAREAWRKNPLARRLVGLITSFVVGDGISLTSDDPDLAAFLGTFVDHEQNRLGLRQYAWCDELARAGELFITLHLNPADGMSYVRALPASAIDRIETAPGDYEDELSYHEAVGPNDPDYPAGRTWRRSPIQTRTSRPTTDAMGPSACTSPSTGRLAASAASRTWRRCCPGCGVTRAGWKTGSG